MTLAMANRCIFSTANTFWDATIESSSASSAQFPVENVLDTRPSRFAVFTSAAATIEVDRGLNYTTNMRPDVVYITGLRYWLASGASTINVKIEAGSNVIMNRSVDLANDGDSILVDMTLSGFSPSTRDSRYWTFTISNPAYPLQVGSVGLAKYYVLDENPQAGLRQTIIPRTVRRIQGRNVTVQTSQGALRQFSGVFRIDDDTEMSAFADIARGYDGLIPGEDWEGRERLTNIHAIVPPYSYLSGFAGVYGVPVIGTFSSFQVTTLLSGIHQVAFTFTELPQEIF
jgi:hypothetical protein